MDVSNGETEWVLDYFAHRGRADLALVLLKLAGKKVRVRWFNYSTFVQLRDECNDFPFRYVPALHVESGQTISESKAIARFAARLAKLIPQDPVAQAHADSFVDGLMDLKTISFYLPGAPPNLAEQCRSQLENICKRLTAVMGLRKENGPFLLGNEMCWADVSLFVEVDGLALWDPELLEWFGKTFPHLDKIVKAVRSLPQVQELLRTDWSKGARWEPTFSLDGKPACKCIRDCSGGCNL